MLSNFCSEALLCNAEITIIGKRNETYKMKLPILKDKIENIDYDIFIGFCATDIKKINKEIGTKFDNKFLLFKYYKSMKSDVCNILIKYFEKYMVGFKIVDDSLYWGNRLVGKEIFEIFCTYCSIAAGVKDIDELKFIPNENLSEIERKQLEYEKKIAETKRKDSESRPLDLILTAVSHEFNCSFFELCNMTIYAIYFMYSKIGAIFSTNVETIALGNGLLNAKKSEINHWAYNAQSKNKS